MARSRKQQKEAKTEDTPATGQAAAADQDARVTAQGLPPLLWMGELPGLPSKVVEAPTEADAIRAYLLWAGVNNCGPLQPSATRCRADGSPLFTATEDDEPPAAPVGPPRFKTVYEMDQEAKAAREAAGRVVDLPADVEAARPPMPPIPDQKPKARGRPKTVFEMDQEAKAKALRQQAPDPVPDHIVTGPAAAEHQNPHGPSLTDPEPDPGGESVANAPAGTPEEFDSDDPGTD